MTAPKRPRDTNQLAKLIADLSTGEAQDPPPLKNEAAASLGSLGGQRSAAARNLSKEQLAEMGRKGAAARWRKK